MDTPILFNSDNRLLGSATGDLGMYGGQSDPHFTIQQAREAALEHSPPTGDLHPDSLAARIGGETPAVSDIGGATGETAFAPTSFVISAPVTAFEPLSPPIRPDGITTIQSDWHPAPIGAGSFIPALEPVHDPAPAPFGEGIAGTALPLLDHLAGGPDLVTGLVSPLVETVGDILGATLGVVEDTLDGLAGGDLLGGVATLVNLVSISDAFDLNPLTAPLADSDGGIGLGMVDTLAADILPDALLGTHHEDGLLGGHDHPLGVGDPA